MQTRPTAHHGKNNSSLLNSFPDDFYDRLNISGCFRWHREQMGRYGVPEESICTAEKANPALEEEQVRSHISRNCASVVELPKSQPHGCCED
jgi:hypothetical protein